MNYIKVFACGPPTVLKKSRSERLSTGPFGLTAWEADPVQLSPSRDNGFGLARRPAVAYWGTSAGGARRGTVEGVGAEALFRSRSAPLDYQRRATQREEMGGAGMEIHLDKLPLKRVESTDEAGVERFPP